MHKMCYFWSLALCLFFSYCWVNKNYSKQKEKGMWKIRIKSTSKSIMLSTVSQIQKDKSCRISLKCGSKKRQTHRKRLEGWSPGSGEKWERRGNVGQRVWTSSYIKWLSSGDIMYSTVIKVNDTILHTWKLLGVELKCSYHKKRNSNYVTWCRC